MLVVDYLYLDCVFVRLFVLYKLGIFVFINRDEMFMVELFIYIFKLLLSQFVEMVESNLMEVKDDVFVGFL